MKQPKHVGKMPGMWKKFKWEVMTTFKKRISAKCTNFEVSRLELLVSKFLMKPRSRPRLEILTRSRSRSRRLRSQLHECLQILDSLSVQLIKHINEMSAFPKLSNESVTDQLFQTKIRSAINALLIIMGVRRGCAKRAFAPLGIGTKNKKTMKELKSAF